MVEYELEGKEQIQRLNQIFLEVQTLTKEKSRLSEEYSKKLADIDYKITEKLREGGLIIAYLTKRYKMSASAIAEVAKVPRAFILSCQKVAGVKEAIVKDIAAHAQKVYQQVLNESPEKPTVSTILLQVSQPVKKRADPERVEKSTFVCGLCGEEHDRLKDYATIDCCVWCSSITEQVYVPWGLYRNHGRMFIDTWEKTMKIKNAATDLLKAMNQLIKFYRARGVQPPTDLLNKLQTFESLLN